MVPFFSGGKVARDVCAAHGIPNNGWAHLALERMRPQNSGAWDPKHMQRPCFALETMRTQAAAAHMVGKKRTCRPGIVRAHRERAHLIHGGAGFADPPNGSGRCAAVAWDAHEPPVAHHGPPVAQRAATLSW